MRSKALDLCPAGTGLTLDECKSEAVKVYLNSIKDGNAIFRSAAKITFVGVTATNVRNPGCHVWLSNNGIYYATNPNGSPHSWARSICRAPSE